MADRRNFPKTVIFLVSKFELLVAELAITVSCLQISNARRKFPPNTHPANMQRKTPTKSVNENSHKGGPIPTLSKWKEQGASGNRAGNRHDVKGVFMGIYYNKVYSPQGHHFGWYKSIGEKYFQLFHRNVWFVLKKAIPLHPLSRMKHFSWALKKEFFERFKINRRVVVQEASGFLINQEATWVKRSYRQ